MNEINRIRQLAGLAPLTENEADMQTASTNGVNQADAEFDAAQPAVTEEYSDSHVAGWIKNAIRNANPVAMSPEELKIMVAGETGYGEHPRYDELFDKAYRTFYALDMEGDDSDDDTDHSMRQGEMGMADGDTMAGHRAFDQERGDWDALDNERDFNEIDFDQDMHEEIDQLMLEFADQISEKAPPGMEDIVMKLKKEYPGEEEKAFATAWSIYNKKDKVDEVLDPWNGYTPDDKKAKAAARAPKTTMKGSSTWSFSDMVCNTIEAHGLKWAFQYYVVKHGLPPRHFKIFAAKALYPWKFDKKDSLEQKPLTKEQYAFEEDLNNGYEDRHYACGDDYFPDGADGPVVDKTGPSGARQGDNPEQKKMQIDEVHNELVYSYRRFLEESSSQKKR